MWVNDTQQSAYGVADEHTSMGLKLPGDIHKGREILCEKGR